MKQPKFLTNKANDRVVDELKEYIGKGSKLSFVSAYFTIYAYSALQKELSKIDGMRFILTQPVKQKEPVYKEFGLIRKISSVFREGINSISGTEYEIKLKNEMLQSSIAKACAKWVRDKCEIRAFRERDTATARYVCVENKDNSLAINGTVDFSTDGLGIGTTNRHDMNIALYDRANLTELLKIFDELWNDSARVEDVKAELLEQMQVLYKENTPEFIYFIMLYNIFYAYLDELTDENIVKTKTGFKNTAIWDKLYKFQRDAVMGVIDKIEKYNGCILADSVGLGKTFTALAVIKYYELRNDRVLVLAPKKLRENWTIYTQNDVRNTFAADRFNYTVLNHTDLGRQSGMTGEVNLATLNWGNYDLVVIDESHNFRNNPPVKGRKTRYERLMNDIIKAGVPTKVLMLSATPVNNKMNDIKNQIAFITEGRNDAFAELGLTSIEGVLRKAQLIFNKWSALPEKERTTERFVGMMDTDYFKLLDTVTIARSRRHIEKYYNLNEIGKFPKRLKPVNLYPELDKNGLFPPIAEVNKMIKNLNLAIYSPLRYVLPEKRGKYEQLYDMEVKSGSSVFRQLDREINLVGLVRVGLLKRMESSVHSFSLTVENIIEKIEATLTLIDQKQGSFQNADVGDLDFDDVDLESLSFGNKIQVKLDDMDLIKWRQDLEEDAESLTKIQSEAKSITIENDSKFSALRDLVLEKIRCPLNGQNKKVIIFTAFADTARYLYDNLHKELQEQGIYSALVTGSAENKSTVPLTAQDKKHIKIHDLNTLLTLFSPNSKERYKIFPDFEKEIDVLIATDCISEGQNLQDCDYLINYDIHWNPVRIIQRFGRIDRLGSQNACIQLVNFWPMDDLDGYINLQRRVKGRMVLLNVSSTGEENIIEEDREMKDLEYRKKQLERLKNEVVDLEDISGGISITDLTFNDFKIDLQEYMKEHKKELAEAPAGLYAVADISEQDGLEEGMLVTLRQIRGEEKGKENNALFPFYMFYITDSGEIRLNSVQAKQILDFSKKICKGNRETAQEAIKLFNEQINDGQDMAKYSALLNQVIDSVLGRKSLSGKASIFSKGGTSLLSAQEKAEDFELVSFLILKKCPKNGE